jgi:hypothetical protein
MSLVKLPSETFKAILAFMPRKQLIELNAVNRLFYSLINSSPFDRKPLLRIDELSDCSGSSHLRGHL